MAGTTHADASSWTISLNGASAGQARSSTAPAAPTGVAATCVSSTIKQIRVTWNAVAHATYTVYQSTTSASAGYTAVASGIATTSWTSASLSTGRTYWYEVAATVGTSWTSAQSAATTGRQISNGSTNCT